MYSTIINIPQCFWGMEWERKLKILISKFKCKKHSLYLFFYKPFWYGFLAQDTLLYTQCLLEFLLPPPQRPQTLQPHLYLLTCQSQVPHSPDWPLLLGTSRWDSLQKGSCQEFHLFKPFRLSFFRTQDSFPTNTHSQHDITQISQTTELIVLCNAMKKTSSTNNPTLVNILKP